MVFSILYSQEYYTQRVLAEEIVEKISTELNAEDLPVEKRRRKEVILQSIKYYFGL
tara:strand:+ start:259 stop:426 length:168 start_codon:yes stop_codon:yes gene_type:complete